MTTSTNKIVDGTNFLPAVDDDDAEEDGCNGWFGFDISALLLLLLLSMLAATSSIGVSKRLLVGCNPRK